MPLLRSFASALRPGGWAVISLDHPFGPPLATQRGGYFDTEFVADTWRKGDVEITIAAYKLVRLTDGKDRRAWAVSAVVFVVTATTGRGPIYLIVGAGLLLILLDARPASRLPTRNPPTTGSPGTSKTHGLALLPLAVPTLGTLTSGGVLISLGLFFLKTGALVPPCSWRPTTRRLTNSRSALRSLRGTGQGRNGPARAVARALETVEKVVTDRVRQA